MAEDYFVRMPDSRIQLSLAAIALIISIVAFILMMTVRPPTAGNQAVKDIVCIECKKLSLAHNFEFDTNWTEKEDGQCCTTRHEVLKTLLSLTSSELSTDKSEELPTYNITNFTFSPVSAHRRLRPSVEYKTTNDMVPVFEDGYIPLHFDIFWSNPLLEHVRGVDVQEKGFRILSSGWYYIYNNIRYNPDSSRPCGDYAKQTWDHNVLRSRANQVQDSETILTTVHTCCDDCSREKASAHTGGVFYLEAGDHLSAEVSGYALVRFDETASFFGLYMLGANTQ